MADPVAVAAPENATANVRVRSDRVTGAFACSCGPQMTFGVAFAGAFAGAATSTGAATFTG